MRGIREALSWLMAALVALLIPAVSALIYVLWWPVSPPVRYLPWAESDARQGFVLPDPARAGEKVALCRHFTAREGATARYEVTMTREMWAMSGGVNTAMTERETLRTVRATYRAKEYAGQSGVRNGEWFAVRQCRPNFTLPKDLQPGVWTISSTGYHDPCLLGICGVREISWPVPPVTLGVTE